MIRFSIDAYSRRHALLGLIGLGASVIVPRQTGAQSVAAPICDPASPLPPTPAQTAGPYFKEGSPERTNLREPGMDGTPLTVTGQVVDADCTPLSDVKIDVWHADAAGTYDNDGYRLRGHLFTDEEGAYMLETIVPGLYPGRTRHIHVRLTTTDGRELTTQLYFPDEPQNASDSIYDAQLEVVPLVVNDNGTNVGFTFVLEG